MLDQMKLGVRAAVGIGLIVVLSLVLGLYSASKLRDASDSDVVLFEQNTVPIAAIGDYRVAINRAHSDLQMAAVTDDAQRRATELAEFREHLQEANVAYERLDKAIKLPEVREALGTMDRAFSAWRTTATAGADEVVRGQREAVQKSIQGGPLARDRAAMQQANTSFTALLVKRADARSDQNVATANSVIALSRGLVAGITLFGIALAWFLMRSVDKEIGKTREETVRLAEAAIAGELEDRGDPNKVSPEFRPILVGFNQVLDAVIGPLNVAADYVDRMYALHGPRPS